MERAILRRSRGSSLASHADAPVGRWVLITGGDSGIGHAVAFAKEGADVAIAYLSQRTRTPAAPQLSSYHSSEVLAPIGGKTLPG
jgi:NAD(P)-dependent dehydrogenase (short-subunit alcohol dehydrogenase family)